MTDSMPVVCLNCSRYSIFSVQPEGMFCNLCGWKFGTETSDQSRRNQALVQSESSDGTERLDVEVARKRVKALASDLSKLANEAASLSVELHKLLNELDGMPSADLTEPHLQVNHV